MGLDAKPDLWILNLIKLREIYLDKGQTEEALLGYSSICQMVQKLVNILKQIDPRDPYRIEMTDSLLEKFLEELVQTARVGEFKKRLELLVAFHGQLNTSIRLKAHSRWWSILLLHGAGHAISLYPAELAKKLPDVIFVKVDDVDELKVKVGKAVGFEILKDQNASDPDFGQIWANRQNGMLVNFLV